MESDIRQLARDTAYDRYLRAVVAPKALQDQLTLIAAFFGEVSRIPFVVREPLAGEVRLQWWRDTLTGETEAAANAGPLVPRMRSFLQRHPFATDAMTSLFTARQVELYPEPMPDMAAFDAWLDHVAQFDVALPARLLGVSLDSPEMAPVMDTGRAIAATDMALRLGRHIVHERVVLPLTFFDGVRPHQCAKADRMAALNHAYRELHIIARTYLQRARDSQFGNKRAGRVATVPAALIEPYFRALQKAASADQLQVVSLAPLAKLMRSSFYVWRRV
jgi:15-cis-phytoene synthase